MIKHTSFEKLTGSILGNYHLERLVLEETWGPVFLARTDATATPSMLRVLAGPASLAPKDRQTYLERFQYQASQIATLQHPNILPLLDYGIYPTARKTPVF